MEGNYAIKSGVHGWAKCAHLHLSEPTQTKKTKETQTKTTTNGYVVWGFKKVHDIHGYVQHAKRKTNNIIYKKPLTHNAMRNQR